MRDVIGQSAVEASQQRPATLMGLTGAQARERLREFGPNAVADETPPSWQVFLLKFWSPVAWLLEAAMIVQIGLGEYAEAMVVGALLLFNAILGFIQEGRANAALSVLKAKLAPSALVRRDGQWIRVPASELVPGDVINLPLGAVVPADARVVSGAVMIDQSMLTGESVAIDLSAGSQACAGSLVRRGQAIAEVTATGSRTYHGRTAELVRIAHASSTEEAAIFAATRNLVVVNGTVGLLIVAYAYALALPTTEAIGLALTSLLASIPVALPATFTLAAALAAHTLAERGVLLTRLSAAHGAAAMDVLCADKTGTLTQNVLEVAQVRPMPGFDRERVLALAAIASSGADQDPIDTAIRAAAAKASNPTPERLLRFVPFDPATRTAEALALDAAGQELRIVKGAYKVVAAAAATNAAQLVEELAQQGNRVIAVAAGPPGSLRLAGLVAISDPPRDDSRALIAKLRELGVRTLMVTGDSAKTAAAIAGQVGIEGSVYPSERLPDDSRKDEFGVFARVLPEQKFALVKALQSHGHVAGMCGDGTNDAPALRQAQIGIAVSTATDIAKAAAGMVMTQPGLAGIVFAVEEGRIAFGRLVTYTLNMLLKKVEIVLFLAVGLWMTGHAILTPALMVLMLVTNDFLSMSLTTDRPSPAPSPSRWDMGGITAAAILLGACKLSFSTAALAFGKHHLGLGPGELQTLAFVTLVFGAQAAMYVVRERHRLWSSRPSKWVLAASAADIATVSALALSGIMMEPLPWPVLWALFVAAASFALVLDSIKVQLMPAFKYPFTGSPKATPPVDKATAAISPDIATGRPSRGRLASAVLVVIALGVAVFLSWFVFFSPMTIQVAPAEANVREEVFGLGTVGARVQSNVGFKVTGVLAALKVDQGDRVRAGQVLAKLDARDVEAQLSLAKAGVAQARANVEKAKADVGSAQATLANAKAISARRAKLVKNKYISTEEAETTEAAVHVAAANLESAQSSVTVAEAALQSAQAQAAFQEATLAYYTLYAPYDAWVVSRNLELGSMPPPGQSVFTLVAAHTVWVSAYVDERLAGPLRLGQPAEIRLRSSPATPIPGHVERIEIQSNPVTEERLVDVAFDRIPDNIHLAGQAEVYITTGVLPRAVLVPAAAVLDWKRGRRIGTVWTVENGRLERRQVTFGAELLDARLPIVGGLPAGAEVVAAPTEGLRVGRPAHVSESGGP